MKKPRHISEDAAESIMQEAGSRSVNTAMFATNVVAILRQHGKVSRRRCEGLEPQFFAAFYGISIRN